MSLLRPMDRRVRVGARVVVAVASGLLLGAALVSAGTACSSAPFQYCDVPDGTVLPPICIFPVEDAGNGEAGDAAGDADAAPILDPRDGAAGDAGAVDDAAADAAPSLGCSGQCAQQGPVFWTDPELVWIGSPATPPECPADAPMAAYVGFAGLDAPTDCAPCTCGPPTGTCAFPETFTANTEPCTVAGPVASIWDAPPGWDGRCVPVDAISTDQGAESVTIQPLTLNESTCTFSVTETDPPLPPPTWQTMLVMCRASPEGTCEPGSVCIPPGVPGFRVCVAQMGEASCSGPELAPYTEQHVVYTGVTDTRSCTCGCGPVTGSSCSSTVRVYEDPACGDKPGLVEVVSHPGAAVCQDVILGMALGGMSATAPTYAPGTCVASGGPSGSAVPADPTTFCCIPSP